MRGMVSRTGSTTPGPGPTRSPGCVWCAGAGGGTRGGSGVGGSVGTAEGSARVGTASEEAPWAPDSSAPAPSRARRPPPALLGRRRRPLELLALGRELPLHLGLDGLRIHRGRAHRRNRNGRGGSVATTTARAGVGTAAGTAAVWGARHFDIPKPASSAAAMPIAAISGVRRPVSASALRPSDPRTSARKTGPPRAGGRGVAFTGGGGGGGVTFGAAPVRRTGAGLWIRGAAPAPPARAPGRARPRGPAPRRRPSPPPAGDAGRSRRPRFRARACTCRGRSPGPAAGRRRCRSAPPGSFASAFRTTVVQIRHLGVRRGRRRDFAELTCSRIGMSVSPRKSAVARQDLVEHDAQREEVAAAVDRLAPGLLGRHVLELALQRAGLGLRGLRRGLRDAEVAELDVALVRDQDVLRRHVAVDECRSWPSASRRRWA